MKGLAIMMCASMLLGCAGHRTSETQKTTGILTNDYGIVTSTDIERNRNIAQPFDRSGEPLLVWQCLPVERFDTFCWSLGYIEDLGEQGYKSGLRIISKGNEYSFECRKFTGRHGCVDDKRHWSRIIKRGQIACFSAFYVGKEPSDEPGLKDWSLWNIERIKSNEGEWSYWMD